MHRKIALLSRTRSKLNEPGKRLQPERTFLPAVSSLERAQKNVALLRASAEEAGPKNETRAPKIFI